MVKVDITYTMGNDCATAKDCVTNELFTVKECVNEKTNLGGTQTLITPKGKETFRLLFVA